MIVGEDVFISPLANIKRSNLVTIGNHVAIDPFVHCTVELIVGSYVHISPGVTIIGGERGLFRVGNFCTVAAGCRIICSSDSFRGDGLVTAPGIPDGYKSVTFGFVRMENYSSLASNVVVCPNVNIREGAVVGANSFVDADIPPWEIWVGSPARFLSKRPSSKMKKLGKLVLGEKTYKIVKEK